MTETLSKEICNYKNEIKKLLNCPNSDKERFLSVLENDISEFIDERSDITIKDIIARFGTPEQAASSFDAPVDEKQLKKSNKVKKITVIASAVIIAVILFLSLFRFFSMREASSGHAEVFLETESSVVYTERVDVK